MNSAVLVMARSRAAASRIQAAQADGLIRENQWLGHGSRNGETYEARRCPVFLHCDPPIGPLVIVAEGNTAQVNGPSSSFLSHRAGKRALVEIHLIGEKRQALW